MKELQLDALTENLDHVLDFMNEILESYECSFKIQTQLAIAVEELYVNIAHYAYGEETGKATIQIDVDDEFVCTITFIDSGTPYDPLAKQDPDVTLSAEERQIGGLGIYMVKKSMDNVTYEYKDNQNILTIQKKIK